jgi:hypothetical protein
VTLNLDPMMVSVLSSIEIPLPEIDWFVKARIAALTETQQGLDEPRKGNN